MLDLCVTFFTIMLPIIAVLLFVGWLESSTTTQFLTARVDDDNSGFTDEEYLALFDWDVDPNIALKVRNIIAEQLNIPRGEITPQSRLVEDLKAE